MRLHPFYKRLLSDNFWFLTLLEVKVDFWFWLLRRCYKALFIPLFTAT